MASQKYRGSCIGAALAKWLAKNTVASQKIALKEKMEDGALEMLLKHGNRWVASCQAEQKPKSGWISVGGCNALLLNSVNRETYKSEPLVWDTCHHSWTVSGALVQGTCKSQCPWF